MPAATTSPDSQGRLDPGQAPCGLAADQDAPVGPAALARALPGHQAA
jgi:hypothetical protein